MKLIKLALITSALCALVWAVACWWVAGQFLTRAVVDYNPSDEQEILNTLDLGETLASEQITIGSETIKLAGSYFANPQPSNCAVILLPGIGGHRTQVLPILPLFRQRGCHVLAYDPRGTGASDRVPRTFGFFEKKDNANAIRWLSKKTGLPLSSIGVWGPSFGAAVGLLTLEETDDLGFVIADSTFHAFDQVAYDTIAIVANQTVATILTPGVIAFLEFRTGSQLDTVNPALSIRDKKTPVLLIHALEDPAMDVSHTEKVYAARTSDSVELHITDWGAGHADSALINPTSYATLINEFLDRRLSH